MLRKSAIRPLQLQQHFGSSHRSKATATIAPQHHVDTASEKYQFLHKHQTPMLHFQPSLPRLPIPNLNKTCERYLAAQRPLLDDAAFAQTERIVNDFRTKEGPKLQTLLKASDKANKHTSYISAPWFEAYLSDRQPLPVNYNVALILKPDTRAEYNTQLIRTTNLVISSLRFRQSLLNQVLKPEVYHLNARKSDTDTYHAITRMAPSLISTYVSYAFSAFPLDMSQYSGLFGSTRIPETGTDRIQRTADTRHIVVMKNGQLFAIDVLTENGTIESPTTILERLRVINSQSVAAPEYPLGVLTSENRDTWAALRKHLVNTGNGASLHTIDSALICVCLDDGSLVEEDLVPMSKQMMAGDGVNRWFDKSISLVVAADGTAGVHFEHSWGDGVAVLRYFNDIYADSVSSAFAHPETTTTQLVDGGVAQTSAVRPIHFTLDDHMKRGIRTAQHNHNAAMQRLAIHTCIYPGMNKQICKQFKLSPDSIMQLGFQLAFFKQHGKYIGSYESCSTAIFRHGRTETIRPCTSATKAFCDAITSRSPPGRTELRALIDECSAVHGALTKEAAMGQGFDRHLFGLRHIAKVSGEPEPALYQDPAFAVLNHSVISSSTLSSPALLLGCFGPVVQDGYGIGYSIQNDLMGAIVSSYPEHRNGPEFVQCLLDAYADINKVVVT